MPLPRNLDSIDLAILKAIARQPEISTREIEVIVYLSRTQALRRLRQLEELGLIVFRNGIPGRAYHYTLSPQVTPEEIEQYNKQRLETNRDPVAREVINIILQGIQTISDILADMAIRIETILK